MVKIFENDDAHVMWTSLLKFLFGKAVFIAIIVKCSTTTF